MKQYVTFGQDHTHTIHGVVFDKDCVATFEAEADNAGRSAATVGRDRAFELFGSKFCLHYTEQNWHGLLSYFPRGFVAVPDKPAPDQVAPPAHPAMAYLDRMIETHEALAGSDAYHAQQLQKAQETRAAVAELIKWQRQAVPLLGAAASWMPVRKCAMSIREIDALLARAGGAA